MKISAPDGTVLTFPDTMSREEIKRVMKEKFPSPKGPGKAVPPIPTPGPTLRSGQRVTLPIIGKAIDDLARSVASGMSSGLADEGAARMDALTGLAPDYDTALEAQRARDRNIPIGQRILGETGGMVAQSMLLGPLAKGVAGAAGQGAAFGFGSGEGGAEERLKNAAVGGAAGGAGAGLMKGLARVVSPQPAPAVQSLMKQGVTPTPGQALGGMARTFEEKAKSIPLLGAAIRTGEERALKQFNSAAINKALAPLGKSIPQKKVGQEAIALADDIISKSYDDTLSGMQANMDEVFSGDISEIVAKAQEILPDSSLSILRRQVKNIIDISQGGRMSGDRAKTVISKLGHDATTFAKSPDAFQRNLGEILGDLRLAFSSLLQRSSSPAKAAQLAAVDRAYSGFLRVQGASASTGAAAAEGLFTPAQLQAVVRRLDNSMRKKNFSKGAAQFQDIATAGQQVLSNVVPNSGTADRLAIGALGTGALVDPVTTTAVAAGLGVPSAAYTPLLQRLIAATLTKRPPGAESVANVVRAIPAGAGAASFFAGP